MKISETYTVRSAQPADATGLHRLIADLAGYQGQRHEVKLSADQLQEQLASQDCPFECLVAQTGDELVGFALFFQTYSTWEGKRGIYLEDFFVNDEMRGRGVGQALLRELARIALERGCARMDWSVLQSNQTAASFYRKLGASCMPHWHHWRFESKDLQRLAC